MTDDRLAQLLGRSLAIEDELRAYWSSRGEDLAEKDPALVAGRHITAFRKSIETWIGLRAMHAALFTQAGER